LAAPLDRLKRHPFALETTLTDSFVLLFAVDATVLQQYCPPGLVLETYGNYGLVALATVRAVGLRPRGAPSWMGGDFMLTGYRVVVRFRAPDGSIRRALRIIQSDTDRSSMKVGGNLFTEYNYAQNKIVAKHDDPWYSVRIQSSDAQRDLHIRGRIDVDEHLPATSPFLSTREARRYTGPLPWTVGYIESSDSFVAVRGHRQAWKPRLVEAEVETCSFFAQSQFREVDVQLAAAFYIDAVKYSWDRGIRMSRSEASVSLANSEPADED
jgi:Uncharacterized conserved protein (COG2071)